MPIGIRIAQNEASSMYSIKMYRDADLCSSARVGDIVMWIYYIATVSARSCLEPAFPLTSDK